MPSSLLNGSHLVPFERVTKFLRKSENGAEVVRAEWALALLSPETRGAITAGWVNFRTPDPNYPTESVFAPV